MTFDRRDWQASREKARQERSPRRTPPIGQIASINRAALNAEHVTKSNEWNEFLTHLQAEINRTQAEIAALTQALLVPEFWNPDELIRHKAAILTLQERVRTLTSVLEMPKRLLEASAKADEWLGRSQESQK